ncbi:MAG TPA: indole-3-glycerol phosphate synthase TrpC [Gemmatimonadaceae bacterium]|nr:indole-3-glycerol phosphate synthase TrpC [Gemmatimonadaceae bacterium]
MPNSNDSRTTTETQDDFGWTPATGTLGRLIDEAETRVEALRADRIALERQASQVEKPPSLRSALRRQNVAIIAEIKRASPSRGSIKLGLDPVAQARAYHEGGASAVSVLTEPESFRGSVEDLKQVKGEIPLPILKKDFHVDEIQLIEARAVGASAALLIVRALSPSRFKALTDFAKGIGLEILAEVRDVRELDTALAAGCEMIGVNNRNLETLDVESGTADSIIPRIPPELIAIAESGYSTRDEIVAVAAAGADAVLVGSFLSASNEPAQAVKAIIDVPRVNRVR